MPVNNPLAQNPTDGKAADREKTIVKTYIRSECKFRTDLHTHMNDNLPPDYG